MQAILFIESSRFHIWRKQLEKYQMHNGSGVCLRWIVVVREEIKVEIAPDINKLFKFKKKKKHLIYITYTFSIITFAFSVSLPRSLPLIECVQIHPCILCII